MLKIVAMVVLLFTTPLAAEAQQAAKVPRIGVFWPGTPAASLDLNEAFKQGLRENGYMEGQNVILERRYAEGRIERLAEIAAELVRMKVDVIVAATDPAIAAVKRQTPSIPIVMVNASDPVGTGFVASLARPGRNITGTSTMSPELSAKRLELLRQILPKMSRVAALSDPRSPSQLRMTENAARSLGLKLQVLEVRGQGDLPGAFQAAKKGKAQALNVLASPLLSTFYQAIIDLAAENRLPAIYQWKEHAQNGGLLSYGPSLSETWRQNALVVAKILKGAKPGDLPVEQPTKFELVINLKTAKALGLTIPQSLLLRADHVIQ